MPTRRACPHCEAPLETPLVCTSCKALRRPAGVPTPYQALGVELRFDVDDDELERHLLRFSRLLHPDFFATAEPAERELAEENSACLNRAYEVLSDPVARADWLLAHLEGPSEQQERQMPQAFLMEVLEWNETLEAARDSAPGSPEREALPAFAERLRGERAELLATIAAKLTPLPAAGAPALLEVRRDLNAVRYVDRALSELERLRLAGAAS
ncbi:MAG: DnaJ domain-containing protein [Planctomycetes bacterium]|nr:DnaJ domain-containing protein [Planctomycetota bacterium]